jgi:hypothetical protein
MPTWKNSKANSAKVMNVPHQRYPRKRAAAFLMMEVVFALAIFGIAVVGLLKALMAISESANISNRDMKMVGLLQSQLTFHSRKPNIREMKPSDESATTNPVDGIWSETTITEIKGGKPIELKNEDGQELQQMFLISVVAHSEVEGKEADMTAETIRYAPLYRNTTTGQ